MENAESTHDSDEFQIAKKAKGFKDVMLWDEDDCSVHAFSNALCSPGLETGEEPESAPPHVTWHTVKNFCLASDKERSTKPCCT